MSPYFRAEKITKVFFLSLCLFCISLPSRASTSPQSVAQAVLDRLYATNGNFRFKKPRLVISAENKKGASFYPGKNTIVLDEKAYKVCRAFGRDSLAALAYVLGHELAHAYQVSAKGAKAHSDFLAYDHAYNADKRREKAADIQGVFNAWLAGYGVLKTMPDVIGEVYRAYGLEDRNLPDYPSLEERKTACREVVAIAENLCAVFESCNYLMVIDQTGLACAGYEYILQYYQGREIYNNLGLAYTLAARQYWNPNTDNFLYPAEADWYTKLERIGAARGEEQMDPTLEPLRRIFLEKALDNFREAAGLDPGYLPARLNTLCALNMSGDPVGALKYAEINLTKYTRAAKKKKTQEQEMVEIALGITVALQPGGARRAEAEGIFQRLTGSVHPLVALYARQNLKALRKEPESGALPEFPLPESLRSALARLQPGRTAALERIPLDPSGPVQFARKPGTDFDLYVFSGNGGNLVSLLRSNRPPEGSALLPAGQNAQRAAYRNIVPAKDGFFLKVPREGGVMKLDKQGRVLELVRYIEHEK